MAYNMVVLAKQVPDTKINTNKAMKEDGTLNRSALPAIFNPEDLNALEEALKIKDQFGGHITVITMGPPQAVEILKQSLYMGADEVILLSDRKFAGSDTLATSYVLASAIKKINKFDILLCGRQAIDGDTAQVGPQTAEKLGIDQITFVYKIEKLEKNKIIACRTTEYGDEVIEGKLPILLTITEQANTPRPPSVKKILTYKNAKTEFEDKSYNEEYISNKKINIIKVWDAQILGLEDKECGFSGSPTKVKKIESVTLKAKSIKKIENSDEGIYNLVKELMEDHIIG